MRNVDEKKNGCLPYWEIYVEPLLPPRVSQHSQCAVGRTRGGSKGGFKPVINLFHFVSSFYTVHH